MKVIDLLNKIANGEQPKKIKYYDDVYEFDCYEGEWGYINKEYYKYRWFAKEIDCDLSEQLNDEIEIIEEDKEIEEIKYILVSTEQNKYLVEKINELIKAVNKLKKGK